LAPFALGIWLEDWLEPRPWLPAGGAPPRAPPGGGAAAGRGGAARGGGAGRAGGRGGGRGGGLLGAGAGALALALRLHAPVPAAPEGPVELTLLEAPRSLAGESRTRVWLHGERPGRAILYARGAACALLPGQSALARVRLETLRPPTNPGAFDPRRRLARRGV